MLEENEKDMYEIARVYGSRLYNYSNETSLGESVSMDS